MSEAIDHTKPHNKVSTRRQYTQDVDAFGRDRVSEPFGIFDNKNIMSKNDNQWEELIKGVIIVHGTVTGGPFLVGETITGSVSGASGVVDVVGAGSLTITVDRGNDFDITTPDVITGGTSGATANVTTINTGSDITFLSAESSVELKCGILADDYAIRETHRHLAYVPGKSQNILNTFVLGAAKANVIQRVGYFNDDDGMFLEQDENGIYVVVRTSTSGSPVDTRVPQADWNQDTFDGKGVSRATLDLTKSQILHMDFQWLGVGTIRFCFSIDGQTMPAHHINNANVLDKVYMATPTLPVRYEIRNNGVPASATTMKEICCSVTSEGGYSLPGLEFSEGLDFTSMRSTSTTRTPIFAIRLKNSFNGKDNRRIGRFLHGNFFAKSADTLFEIAHLHNPIGIYGTGGAPTLATWIDVGGGSAIEYSTDITAVTGRPEHVVADTPVATGQGSKGGGDEEDVTFINLHSYFSQNHDSSNSQMYVVYATTDTGTGTAYASMRWIEFE
jgi:hypothetical protein